MGIGLGISQRRGGTERIGLCILVGVGDESFVGIAEGAGHGMDASEVEIFDIRSDASGEENDDGDREPAGDREGRI